MNVKIVDRQPTLVAYRRYVGPVGAPLLAFWKDEVYPWMVTHGLVGQPRYGISHDDPSITAPEKFRYDACVELPPGFTLADGTPTTTIPGGKYASLHFEGKVEEMEEAWSSLLRDWLPASVMQLDARPLFEHYPAGSRYDAETGRFDCELCIPVAPM
jgi:AraC family transcriptional regulator